MMSHTESRLARTEMTRRGTVLMKQTRANQRNPWIFFLRISPSVLLILPQIYAVMSCVVSTGTITHNIFGVGSQSDIRAFRMLVLKYLSHHMSVWNSSHTRKTVVLWLASVDFISVRFNRGFSAFQFRTNSNKMRCRSRKNDGMEHTCRK